MNRVSCHVGGELEWIAIDTGTDAWKGSGRNPVSVGNLKSTAIAENELDQFAVISTPQAGPTAGIMYRAGK
jgi:hypothetical protein